MNCPTGAREAPLEGALPKMVEISSFAAGERTGKLLIFQSPFPAGIERGGDSFELSFLRRGNGERCSAKYPWDLLGSSPKHVAPQWHKAAEGLCDVDNWWQAPYTAASRCTKCRKIIVNY